MPVPPSFPTLVPYGWDARLAASFAQVATPGAAPGRVLRHDAIEVVVAESEAVGHRSLVPGAPPVVVGDWVVVAGGTVVGLLPRTSLLRRSDATGDREQPLAANLDVLGIVAGLDRPVKAGRLQRSVALAWDAGAMPLVVLTKADLVADPEAARAAAAGSVPGVEVLALSAASDTGLDRLREAVGGRTVVLLGESGAGKSTLANALVGDEVAVTGAVRSGDAKGRHTTTARQLHLLPGGGTLIDTPGIRGVGLWVDARAVDATFSDVVDLAERCRFGDCRHDHEPGCAVQAAVVGGAMDRARLDAWARMRREAAATELRADEHARRRAQRRSGRIAREAQRRKGRR